MQDSDGGKPVPLTPEGTKGVRVSPDGKTLAAISSDRKLWLFPIQRGYPKFLINVDSVEEVDGWSDDGKYLFLTKYGLPAELYRIDAITGARRLLRSVAPADPAGVSVVGPVLVTQDGKSYVYEYTRTLSTLYAVHAF